jgi:hypothetical protein
MVLTATCAWHRAARWRAVLHDRRCAAGSAAGTGAGRAVGCTGIGKGIGHPVGTDAVRPAVAGTWIAQGIRHAVGTDAVRPAIAGTWIAKRIRHAVRCRAVRAGRRRRAAPTSRAATLSEDNGRARSQRGCGKNGYNGARRSFRHWNIPDVDNGWYANVSGLAAFHDGSWPAWPMSYDGHCAATCRYNRRTRRCRTA